MNTNYICKFVRKNRKVKTSKFIGTLVALASESSSPCVFLGWSKCKLSAGDVFDKERGLRIALGRAQDGGGGPIPRSLLGEYTEMSERAVKYFKDKKVYASLDL